MANFTPLNNYILFLLDKVRKKYHLEPPFLDIACGTGYLSRYLGNLGWQGKAIDFSEKAIKITQNNLKDLGKVIVERKSASKENGKYKTVLMFDFLEHVKEDLKFLRKVHSLLIPGGFIVICVPSNPKEWRWDDDFYGHYRRYTKNDLNRKFIQSGFKPIIFYDYTFPFFWALRRIYTKLKKKKVNYPDKEKQTAKSSFAYAWSIPVASALLDKTSLLWIPIYIIQYTFFRKKIYKGNAMFVLAKRL